MVSTHEHHPVESLRKKDGYGMPMAKMSREHGKMMERGGM